MTDGMMEIMVITYLLSNGYGYMKLECRIFVSLARIIAWSPSSLHQISLRQYHPPG